jgi:hypothetical protein
MDIEGCLGEVGFEMGSCHARVRVLIYLTH